MWLGSLPDVRHILKPQQQLTFVRAALPAIEMVEPARKAPPLRVPAPEPPAPPSKIVEMRKPVTMPVPEPPAARPSVPELPVARRPVVNVGEFAAAPAPIPRVDQRQVHAVGFESQVAVAPDIKMRATDVGTFGPREIKDPRPGTDRPGTVNASGFESTQRPSPAGLTRTSQTVMNSGFGSVSAAPQSAGAREAVKPTGFSSASPASPAATVRQKTEERVTPAEVLFKPTPTYSEEARAQKIEGTVTLEVEFSATGQVRVLRVVRGLGYGLDEMAVRAAEQIRFKPAQSAGKPVDFTANVQIVFHLT